MHNNNSAPIFIVGTPRSGTTLIAKILGRHSRIHMPAENHFFEDIYARRTEFGDLTDPACVKQVQNRLFTLYGRYNHEDEQRRFDELLEDEENRRQLNAGFSDYRTLFKTFMQLQMEHAEKERWGNNTPKDLFHINEILSFFPDAKIIICVRDVRDFLSSYKNRWKTTTIAHQSRLKKLYHPVVTSFLWKANVKRIAIVKKRVAKNNCMVCKYEDLVENPERIVKKICNFLGEKFQPEMLMITTHNSSDNTVKTGIFTSSVGKWRGELDRGEAYTAQWINKRELTELGYPLVRQDVTATEIIKIILSTPGALISALAANKENRGPLIPYAKKRAASLFSRSK